MEIPIISFSYRSLLERFSFQYFFNKKFRGNRIDVSRLIPAAFVGLTFEESIEVFRVIGFSHFYPWNNKAKKFFEATQCSSSHGL